MTRLDDEIRSRMRAEAESARATPPAWTVLRDLQPRLRSARRLRRAATGSMGVVLIGVTTLALRAGLADTSSTMIRAADQSAPEIDQQVSGSSGSDDRAVTSDTAGSVQTAVSPMATVTAEPSTSSSAPMPTSPGIDNARAVPSIPGLSPTATTPPDTVTTTSVGGGTVSSTSTSISPVAPSWSPYRIASACGSVDVKFLGDRVELVQVMADDGFSVDVKNDGPEEVEVGLHGGNHECEVKARVVGGQLVTTAKGPGGDDD